MMSANPPADYEAQTTSWSCGAAALTMVYRRLGRPCDQEAVWDRLEKAGFADRSGTRARGLARDAEQQGLRVLIVQVRDPWLVLERCLAQGVEAVLNHRLESDSLTGHYSVLVGLEEDHVQIHDPFLGPDRKLAREEFLRLWNPLPGPPLLPGQILLAIAPMPLNASACTLCEKTCITEAACPACRQTLSLALGSILGCLANGCPMRGWEQVFCPACDHGWSGPRLGEFA